jgi:hypothetical protein
VHLDTGLAVLGLTSGLVPFAAPGDGLCAGTTNAMETHMPSSMTLPLAEDAELGRREGAHSTAFKYQVRGERRDASVRAVNDGFVDTRCIQLVQYSVGSM